MVPTIRTDDERATNILDAAGVPYELINHDLNPNPEDYILLEGREGKDGYPDLLVCKYRLEVDGVVRNAGRELNLNLKNTAQELNGKGYVGNINRAQSLKLNLMLGGKTLNARTGKDFFKLLFSGKAFDGNRKRIPEAELSQIAEEIMGMRDPYRAESFEDYFTKEPSGLILNKNYVFKNGALTPEYSHALISCLMKDQSPGISLDDWIKGKNITAQGYPRKNVISGDLWYSYPQQDSTVRFSSAPGGISLECDTYPESLNDRRGVRHVLEVGKNK